MTDPSDYQIGCVGEFTDAELLSHLRFAITPEVETDKGEQCVVCGKDSWTCEHFEEWNRDE